MASMVHDTADVSGLLWPPERTILKFMSHADTDCKDQGGFFCSAIKDCRLTVGTEGKLM